MINFKNKNTRVIIIIMMTLVIVSFFVSKVYYQNVNEAVDPRIVPARKMYAEYNELAQSNDFHNVFLLLDSIERIYGDIPHYENSFEMGVLANNRAAVYLTLALHQDSIVLPDNSSYLLELNRDTLIEKAMLNVSYAIEIYENWQKNYGDLSTDACEKLIRSDFFQGLENYSTEEREKFLETRLNTFMQNQLEIKRRLSVSYTNLGMVYRQKKDYDRAIESYKHAINLWDRNITAENNLNVLLGRPLKKPSVIEKLFPPDKD
jgi:tetratricopeptide (TPR) repeat protein